MSITVQILNLNFFDSKTKEDKINEETLEFKKSQVTIAKKNKSLDEFILSKLISRVQNENINKLKFKLFYEYNDYYFYLNIDNKISKGIKNKLEETFKQLNMKDTSSFSKIKWLDNKISKSCNILIFKTDCENYNIKSINLEDFKNYLLKTGDEGKIVNSINESYK